MRFSFPVLREGIGAIPTLAVLVLGMGGAGEVCAQAGPNVRLEVQIEPAVAGVEIQVAGRDAVAVTDQGGRAALALPAGRYELLGTTPLGEQVTRWVEVGRWGGEVSMEFPGLRSAGGLIEVRTTPGAEVFLENGPSQRADEGGLARFRGMHPGVHVVRARAADGRSSRPRSVELDPGEVASIEITFPALGGGGPESEEEPTDEDLTRTSRFWAPGTGIVLLFSDEEEPLDIRYRGMRLGRVQSGSPFSIRLPVGHQELVLEREGRASWVLPVTVAEGDPIQARFPPDAEELPVRESVSPLLILFLSGVVSASFVTFVTRGKRTGREKGAWASGSEEPSEPEDAAPPSTSEVVGSHLASRYRMLRCLGEGGMGTVFLAEHVHMGRKDAIKLLRPDVAFEPDIVARFRRGARILARLRHPNICQIYDFGETDRGRLFLAMEYLDGPSLRELLERDGPLDPERAVRFVGQAADALSTAHDLGVIHRDVKPDNLVVIRSPDGSEQIKVVDFDIARAPQDEGAGVTRQGWLVGTPRYMSPEQVSGDRLDPRTDVYSLALVFFRAVTGRLPFEEGTARSAMVNRVIAEPLTLSQAQPTGTFSPRMEGVVREALARNPEERPSSARDFARKLQLSLVDLLADDDSSSAPTRIAPAEIRSSPEVADS